MDLIDLLVSKLDISEEQALGGAGVLFRLAQEKLSSDQFAQIAENVSGMDDIIAAAPVSDGGGLMANLAGMLSAFGGSGKLGALAGLAGDFDKLNIDSSLVNRFISLLVGFIRDQGGDEVGDLLDGVLSS